MDKQYVWGVRYIDELVCRDDVTPQRLYAMQDANFNLTSISDTSGSVVERYLFDPYGTRTIMNASWSVISVSAYDWVVGHQGLMHDEEDGLVFDRRRYINPVMGRFMTHDPIGYRDGLNLYEYERSNPADLIDPFGLTSSGCCCGLDVTSWYVDEIKYWQQRIADDEYAMFFFSWRFILAKESPLLDYKYRNFSGSTNEPNTITLCGKCLPKDQLGNIMYGIIAQELDLVEAARNYGHGHGPGTWIYNGPKTPWGKARFKETGFDLGVLLESQFENGTPVDVNHLCSAVNAKVFNSSNR
jgi:RHS repeat-associated protein